MNKRKEQTEASLIEFVIVLIPFLVLVFASIEFAVACYNQAMLTNASREAARAGAPEGFVAGRRTGPIAEKAIMQLGETIDSVRKAYQLISSIPALRYIRWNRS
jgi:Flp pilus assembly protein TadG